MESAYGVKKSTSPLLNEDVKMYYRDYICGTSGEGYQSLHITVYDNSSRSFMEVQLRTQKWMTLRKLVRQITWDMRRNSRMSVQDVMLFQKASAFISMKL